ncbi:MAG: MFS transporter [Hyphomicrobiaceae bacterium]
MSTFGLRVSLFFAALFLVYGVHIPFLPLWLEWRGLTPTEIGLVTSAPYLARLFVTPTVGVFADRVGDHARIVRMLSGVALLAALLLSQSVSFVAIFAAALTLAVATWTIMPLTETVAIRGVRLGLDYGRMRLWGSLSFIAATFIGGAAVDWFGRGAGVWLIVFGLAATLAAAFLLPGPAEGGARAPSRGIDAGAVWRLVRDPRFLLFLGAIGMVHASHAAFYTFGAIHWRATGLSSLAIGALWGIGVLTEIALFAVSRRLMDRFGAVTLLAAGAGAALLRWLAMSFDPAHVLLVPLQILHGLSYGAAHLGAIHFIDRAVPQRAGGTAQALYATMAAGVMHGGATLLSGLLYGRLGEATYLAMAAMAAIGIMCSFGLSRCWSGEELSLERD